MPRSTYGGRFVQRMAAHSAGWPVPRRIGARRACVETLRAGYSVNHSTVTKSDNYTGGVHALTMRHSSRLEL
jgi:hypothetical protein